VVAWCLSLEDLFVSKALAGREKDFEFFRALLDIEAVDADLITSLLEGTDTIEAKKNVALKMLSSGS
jgi:hypothetical protein